jgi:hypothetical protein
MVLGELWSIRARADTTCERRYNQLISREEFMATGIEHLPITSEYADIARRPLEAERCALIVIDIQEKLLPPIFQREQLVRNSQLLIRAAGTLKIPALVSTQYAKGLGGTVADIASLLPGVDAIDKTLFSCFGSDVFCSVLKRLPGQRNTLLLCGMESHICIIMRNGKSHLRDPDRPRRPARRLRSSRRIRRRELADGMELEDRARSHARRRRRHLIHRDDDL